MADRNTDLGGPRRDFPHTTANFLRELRNPGAQARHAVMEMMAERYWKPVYQFLRMTYGKGNEDAKDLTQAFFAWLLERELLLKYDPARSSFRTFLKGILRNFAGNEHQALQRLKRGGAVKILALAAGPADVEDPGGESDPDKAFDTVFLKDAIDRAIERVRLRYESGRRIVPFLAFQAYHLSKSPQPTYELVARQLGVKASDVRNYLHEVREAVRAEVRAEFEGDGGEVPPEAGTIFK
jgi:RNA polymerase sigma factor (sigma-70 family)